MMMMTKKRRSHQSAIAQRYLAAIDGGTNTPRELESVATAETANLSPLSRRSTKTNKTALTEPLDQSASNSWVTTTLTPNRNAITLDPGSPSRPQQHTDTGGPLSQPHLPFRIFPSPNVATTLRAVVDGSDHSSLTSRRTSVSAQSARNTVTNHHHDAEQQSSFDDSAEATEVLVQHDAGVLGPITESLEQSFGFLFQRGWNVTCHTGNLTSSTPDQESAHSLHRNVSDFKSDVTGASTQIVTNRAVDLALQRFRDLKQQDGSQPPISRIPEQAVQATQSQPHPLRYSFGTATASLRQLEEVKSLLSVSSNDDSREFRGVGQTHVAVPTTSRLGRHVQKQQLPLMTPAQASISSSVGPDINQPNTTHSAAAKSMFHQKQQLTSQLLMPDLSKERQKTTMETQTFTTAKKTDDNCVSPPSIKRAIVGANHAPDPIFCPSPPTSSQASQSHRSSSEAILTPSLGDTDSERATIGGKWSGIVASTTTAFSPDRSAAPSDEATLHIRPPPPPPPPLPEPFPPSVIHVGDDSDSVFDFPGSSTGSAAVQSNESGMTMGSEPGALVSEKAERTGASLLMPQLEVTQNSSSSRLKMKSSSKEVPAEPRPALTRRAHPAFLAVLSKFESQRHLDDPVDDDHDVVPQEAPVGNSLAQHLAANTHTNDKSLNMSRLSVDVSSIRSAFESWHASNESGEEVSKDDSEEDDCSVRSLRERFEPQQKPAVPESAVSRMRALFEPKQTHTSRRDGPFWDVITKFEGAKSRPATNVPMDRPKPLKVKEAVPVVRQKALKSGESPTNPVTSSSVADRIRAFNARMGSPNAVQKLARGQGLQTSFVSASGKAGVRQESCPRQEKVNGSVEPRVSLKANEANNHFSVRASSRAQECLKIPVGQVVKSDIGGTQQCTPLVFASKSFVKPVPITPVPVKVLPTAPTPTSSVLPQPRTREQAFRVLTKPETMGSNLQSTVNRHRVAKISVNEPPKERPSVVPMLAERQHALNEGTSQSDRIGILPNPATHGQDSTSSLEPSDRSEEGKGFDSESEFSDGVTLDLSIAEVSNLTTPTALVSRAGEKSVTTEGGDSSSKSVDMIESEAKRSEASSSQASEAAAPLIAKAMRLRPMSDELSANSFFAKRAVIANHWSRTSGWESSLIENPEEKKEEEWSHDSPGSGWDLGRVQSSFPVTTSSSPRDIFDIDSIWQSASDTSSEPVAEKQSRPSSHSESGMSTPSSKTPTRNNTTTFSPHTTVARNEPFVSLTDLRLSRPVSISPHAGGLSSDERSQHTPMSSMAHFVRREEISSLSHHYSQQGETRSVPGGSGNVGVSGIKSDPGTFESQQTISRRSPASTRLDRNIRPIAHSQSPVTQRPQMLFGSPVEPVAYSKASVEQWSSSENHQGLRSTCRPIPTDQHSNTSLSSVGGGPSRPLLPQSATESTVFARTHPRRHDPATGKRITPSTSLAMRKEANSVSASAIERLPIRLPPSQRQAPSAAPEYQSSRFVEQHNELMARLRSLKEARIRRMASYARSRSLLKRRASRSVPGRMADYDEYSSSSRSSTQHGGSTFLAALEVD